MATRISTATPEIRLPIRQTVPGKTSASAVSASARSIPEARGLNTWQAICPTALLQDPVLAAVKRELDRPGTSAELRACEAEERYPAGILERLYSLGPLTLFADPMDGPASETSVSAWRVNALCALTARRSGSLAVAIAHNGLAMLPLYIAGTAEQLREAAERMRGGELATLLLTEREHGSDLLSIQTRAERGTLASDGSFGNIDEHEAVGAFRLRGRKHLINGGIVLRMGNFYSPDAPHTREMLALARWGIAPHLGRRDSFLPLLRVEDAAAAVVAAMLQAPAGVYNVVDDEPLNRGEIDALVAGAAGRRRLFAPPLPLVRLLAGRDALVVARSQRVSNRRLREATGWSPQVRSAREGWARIANGA